MTVTVVPTVEAATIPPRVRLDVSGTTEIATTVLRLNPDGTSSPVRTTDGGPLPLSGTGLLYDYEAPFGQPVSYTTLESPDVVSVEVTVSASQPWLIHPGVPALSMPIMLRPGTLQDETYTVTQGVFWPLGRSTPVVVTDGARKASASSVTVATQSLDEQNSIKALLADAGVLLLNIPVDMATGFDTSYIAIGPVKISRWTDTVIDANRDVTMPFNVVARPAGGSQSERTYADVLADFATYADVLAAYGSYADLLAGP